MTTMVPLALDEQIKRIARDPKLMRLLGTILEDPRRAIESLDFLIRSPGTSPESRRHYQRVRSAVENYMVEQRGKQKNGA